MPILIYRCICFCFRLIKKQTEISGWIFAHTKKLVDLPVIPHNNQGMWSLRLLNVLFCDAPSTCAGFEFVYDLFLSDARDGASFLSFSKEWYKAYWNDDEKFYEEPLKVIPNPVLMGILCSAACMAGRTNFLKWLIRSEAGKTFILSNISALVSLAQQSEKIEIVNLLNSLNELHL